MASTTFSDGVTPIVSSWLNDVNNFVYVTGPGFSSSIITAQNTANTAITTANAAQTTANAAVPSTTLAASGGSSLVGFLQAGTGAVARTVQSKERDTVSVKDFGAVGDGVTNDTAAMNAAHATGQLIYYPPGAYYFSTLNPFSKGGIIGAGRSLTTLVSTDTSSGNTLTYSGTNSGATPCPLFKDFTLISQGVKSGGAGLSFIPSSGELGYFHFDNVTFAGYPTSLYFNANSYYTINNCQFFSYTVAGVVVDNVNNPDSGDSCITNCLFNGTSGAGILQHASGGLKIIGNKFLGGSTGYNLQFNGSNNTSDLLIVGNSFENMSGQDIALTRTGGTFNFSNIVITGNQFAVGPTGIQTDASNFINEMVIVGNSFNLSSGTGYGINLATITDFVIGNNTFKGNGGTPAGILISASCSNGKILPNTYATLTTTVANSSATTFITKDVQTGSSTTVTTGWASFGGLFSGPSTAVAFPTAFTVAPSASDIVLRPTSTNGAVAALVTFVSANGFNYTPISTVTGIAAVFAWSAAGVI